MAAVKFGFTADQLIREGRVTSEGILNIKKWNVGQSKLPDLTDEQIALFLSSCSNDLEATKFTIKEYYAVRKSNPVLFDDRKFDSQEMQKVVETYYFCLVPELTDDGYAVALFSIRDTNYRKFEFAHSLKVICMTIDSILYERPPKGFIVIFNMKGFGLLHLAKFRVNILTSFFRYIQEGMYIKLKEVHVLNTLSWIDKLMFVIKPFIKPELLDKLHFHTSQLDMELFYKTYVPRKCVPSTFGGTAPDMNVLSKQTLDRLTEMEPYFNEEQKQRHSVSDN